MKLKKENLKNSNNKYKLITLDIDGTLLTNDYIISDYTKDVLKMAKDQGILITVATGRFYLSAIRIAKEIGINAPMVCNDGALIKDIYSDKTVFIKPLSIEISQEILDIITKYDTIKVQIFMENYRIFIGNHFKKMQFETFMRSLKQKPLDSCINYYRDFLSPSSIDIKDISAAKNMMKRPPVKIVVCGDKHEIRELKIELRKKFGNDVFLTTAVKNWIDIIHGDVSKAKGVAILAEKLGIKREETIAIGDNINDIPMLTYAGLGIAMGNASDIVKKAADMVTLSNDCDGAAKAIEEILNYNDKLSTSESSI